MRDNGAFIRLFLSCVKLMTIITSDSFVLPMRSFVKGQQQGEYLPYIYTCASHIFYLGVLVFTFTDTTNSFFPLELSYS